MAFYGLQSLPLQSRGVPLSSDPNSISSESVSVFGKSNSRFADIAFDNGTAVSVINHHLASRISHLQFLAAEAGDTPGLFVCSEIGNETIISTCEIHPVAKVLFN